MSEKASDAIEHVEQLVEKEGETIAARFARENNKLTIRECSNDLLELPSH